MKPLIVPFFISHQGCPHLCVFCNQTKIAGGGELPTTTDLLGRIAAWRATGRGRPLEVAFYGGTFTNLPAPEMARLLLTLQPLLARREIDAIRVSTRPDAIAPEIAEYLAGMGVRTVELGVQSMDDEVLALAGRGHTASHTVQACSTLKAAGIAVGMQLMPGLPGDNEEKTLRSLRLCLSLSPDFMRIYPALVIAGTRLAQLYLAGEFMPMALDEAVRLCSIMLHAALAARVKVIRIGLQPTTELDSAGPYHPAFRQLVESALCYELISKLTVALPAPGEVTVRCAPARVAEVAGQKRGNLERLQRERGVAMTAVIADPALSPLEIVVSSGKKEMKGNIVADLDYSTGGVFLG